MNKIELLEMLTKNAADYSPNASESIERNGHMNNIKGVTINPDQIDALLVDFINFVGMKQGVDLALYTSDLVKLRDEYVDPNIHHLPNPIQ